ncbi:hypothetical protein C0J52_26496 [Blattella germanica]|nr:hypothetical protein C0J52_26496 [Blattella germanica]
MSAFLPRFSPLRAVFFLRPLLPSPFLQSPPFFNPSFLFVLCRGRIILLSSYLRTDPWLAGRSSFTNVTHQALKRFLGVPISAYAAIPVVVLENFSRAFSPSVWTFLLVHLFYSNRLPREVFVERFARTLTRKTSVFVLYEFANVNILLMQAIPFGKQHPRVFSPLKWPKNITVPFALFPELDVVGGVLIHCFRGFPTTTDDCEMESVISDNMQVTQELISAAGFTFDATTYMNIDSEIPTECDSQDTAAILQLVQDGNSEDHDDDDNEENNTVEVVMTNVTDVSPISSYAEALDINTLSEDVPVVETVNIVIPLSLSLPVVKFCRFISNEGHPFTVFMLSNSTRTDLGMRNPRFHVGEMDLMHLVKDYR